jgi:hypothetical protein
MHVCDADEIILVKVRMLEEELLIATLKPFNGEPWWEAGSGLALSLPMKALARWIM